MEESKPKEGIPGRSMILASSVVFVFASVFLLLEFIFIYAGPAQFLYYGKGRADWATNDLINAMGLISCSLWFLGFVLLIEWIVFYTFPIWGPNRRALAGATTKLIASVLFNIQPYGYLIDDRYGLPGVGVPWSNFVGIVFFHFGNCIDSIGMLRSGIFDTKAPLKWSNLPVYGICTYCAATWFLVIADAMAYLSTPEQIGDCEIGPLYHPDINKEFISPGQIIGSTLLLIGSLIYTVWACFETDVSDPKSATAACDEEYDPLPGNR